MKPGLYIFLIFFFTVLFFVLAFIVEPLVLDTYPPQLPDNITMEQWRASFRIWAAACVGAAGITSFLWYVLGQWFFKINRWQDTEGKRWIWGLLSLLPIVAIVLSCFLVERAESNLTWVYVLFFLNGLLPYYLITLFFSPSAFKHIPIGAKRIRHW